MSTWLDNCRFLYNWMLVDRELAYHASFIMGDYCILKWKSECCPLTCSPSKGSYFGYPWKDNGGVSKRKKDDDGKPKKVNPRRSVAETQITHVTQLKKQFTFLKDVDATVLQQTVRRVDDAFNGFFNEGRGYPNFKNRSNFKSFQYATGIDAANRDGEKFVCVNCSHIDDANLQAAVNIKRRGVKNFCLVLKTKPRKVKVKVRQDLSEPKQLCLFEMPTDELTSGKKRYRGSGNRKHRELGNQIGKQLTLFELDIQGSSYSAL